MIPMLSQPNRQNDDLVFQKAMQRQRQSAYEPQFTPDELQLTPSERSASTRKYLLSLGLIALSVLVILALVLFFIYR